jgi:hypothetical protein
MDPLEGVEEEAVLPSSAAGLEGEEEVGEVVVLAYLLGRLSVSMSCVMCRKSLSTVANDERFTTARWQGRGEV